MNTMITNLVALILAITGYRFNKYHRQHETMLYRLVGTTMANIKANELSKAWRL